MHFLLCALGFALWLYVLVDQLVAGNPVKPYLLLTWAIFAVVLYKTDPEKIRRFFGSVARPPPGTKP